MTDAAPPTSPELDLILPATPKPVEDPSAERYTLSWDDILEIRVKQHRATLASLANSRIGQFELAAAIDESERTWASSLMAVGDDDHAEVHRAHLAARAKLDDLILNAIHAEVSALVAQREEQARAEVVRTVGALDDETMREWIATHVMYEDEYSPGRMRDAIVDLLRNPQDYTPEEPR